jgi:hypothetical protein
MPRSVRRSPTVRESELGVEEEHSGGGAEIAEDDDLESAAKLEGEDFAGAAGVVLGLEVDEAADVDDGVLKDSRRVERHAAGEADEEG